MDYIIETENLTKRYGTATVVDKVNLHVPTGKIFGLLGRNGAGKTTAMKMMLQLALPTDGTVRLFGTNYKENIHTLYSKVELTKKITRTINISNQQRSIDGSRGF